MPTAGKDKQQRQQSQRMKAMPSFEQGVNGEFIERTKAGTISRMRSHNGNRPMIPQDHRCDKCPAKFTRITHLQRHLRTHDDTRQYKCERCGSEFTRRDLLTRHIRTCGDSTHPHRSRRRSCQACVEGKAKCDLKQPCTRCALKQWTCMYKPYQSLSPMATFSPQLASEVLETKPTLSSLAAGPSRPSPYVLVESSRSLSQLSDDPDLHLFQSVEDLPDFNSVPDFQIYRTHTERQASSYAGSSHVESSYAESSVLSGGTPVFNSSQSHGNLAHGARTMSTAINTLLSDSVFQQYYWNVVNQNSNQGAPVSSVSMPNLSRQHDNVPWGIIDMQPFMADTTAEEADQFGAQALLGISNLMSEPMSPSHAATTVPALFPYPSEFQHYMHLFYHMFLAQMPIVHIATFSVNDKPSILISAMQACGALYARTPAAGRFIDDTLASSRDQLAEEFAKNPQDFNAQVHLILAVVLLQTIGLFHQTAEQRAQSNQYHNMLVMMIRHSGLVQRVTNWQPPTQEQIDSSEAVWYEWAFHETTKRALLLSYLHDTCHCIYFKLQPLYDADEMTVALPCENKLWEATGYEEWKKALSLTSSYGPLRPRLQPLGLQTSLAKLADQSVPEDAPPIIVTPFAHFILSHAILRKLFTDCIGQAASGEEGGENVPYEIQFMLHKWLSSWYKSPDTPSTEDAADPIFLHDALPFYWIAQVLLLAHRENLLPFGNDHDKSGEGKYTLVKEWMRLIRELLRKGKGETTLFWDELMRIQMRSKTEEASGRTSPNGLLGFFAEGI